MSEPSVISPITPVRVLPRFTPSPPALPPQQIQMPVRSQSSLFFATGSPSPINHNSPSFINFSPRRIPGVDLPIPGLDVPIAGPSGRHTGQSPDYFDQNAAPSNQHLNASGRHAVPTVDEDVSALLSNLRVDNSAQSSQLQDQAASISLLKAQARQDKTAIKDLQADNKKIKDVFHGKLLRVQSVQNESLAHLRGLFEGFREGFDGRMGRLESQPLVHDRPRIFIEPPHESNIFFTGMPRETNNFCFVMRSTFERIGEQFNTEKQKILWIAGYFRSDLGRMDESVPSYVWWRGLLAENASVLKLPTLNASSKMNYVIPELRDSESFISAIKNTFQDHHELERAEAAFHAARQGNKRLILTRRINVSRR